MSKMVNSAKRTVKSIGNVLYSPVNITKAAVTGKSVSDQLKRVGDELLSSTGIPQGISTAGEYAAEWTGAKAAQEQLQMQAEMSRRESRRQALLSDALARSEGGEGARVITGGRRKKTSGQASTGISGASGSRGTGVQG